jgi:ABC-2 type transport system permease protein
MIKSTKQAGAVLGGVLTVLGMLGGLMTIGVGLPPALETITLFTPQGWAMRAWQSALDGSPPSAALVPLLVMLAMGCVFFALGVGLARRRFA